MNTISKKNKIILTAVLGMDMILLGYFFSPLEFTHRIIGQLLFQFFWVSLAICIVLGIRHIMRTYRQKLFVRIVVYTGMGCVLLAMGIVWMVALIQLNRVSKTGSLPMRTLIRTMKIEDISVKTYRLNCGATCDYDILLREEKDIIKNFLKTSHTIALYPDTYDVAVEYVGNGVLKIVDTTFHIGNETNIRPHKGDTLVIKGL